MGRGQRASVRGSLPPGPAAHVLLLAVPLLLPSAAAQAPKLLPSAAAQAPLPADDMRRQIDEVWRGDIAAWREHAFRRSVLRQSFDADGNETFRQELEFQVTPAADGFDEALEQIDGREPTPGEVKEHRKKARFTNHYGQAADLELNNPLGENIALLPIIRGQDHIYVGLEEIDGIPCHRTMFAARPDPGRGSAQERLRFAIRGSSCYSVDGYHLVEFEMETVRRIKKIGASIDELQLRIASRPVGEAWLPRAVDLRSEVTVLGKKLRKGNTYRYSGFEPHPVD